MDHCCTAKIEEMDKNNCQNTGSEQLSIEVDPAYIHSVSSEDMVHDAALAEVFESAGVASEEMVCSVVSEEMVHSVASEVDSDLYCRLCATTGVGNLLGIFSQEGERLNILEKIGICLPIIVYPADNLPLKVCGCCLEKLNASYNLVIESLNAEKVLKAMFMSSLWNQYEMQDNLGEAPEVGMGVVMKEENKDAAKVLNPKVVTGKDSCNNQSYSSLENGNVSAVDIKIEENPITNEQGEEIDLLMKSSSTENKEGVVVKYKASPVVGPITCDICNVIFTDMSIFDEHVSDEHLKKWQCRLCDESFENCADLLAHKVVEHSSELVACEVCDNAEEDEWDMVEEWLETPEVHPELQCRLCNKVFPSERKLERHYLVHVVPNPTCKECGAEFQSQYSLMLHKQEKHPKEDFIPCNHCGKLLVNGLAFALHKKRYCRFRKKLFHCNNCDQTFFKEGSLKLHLKVHSSRVHDQPCDDVKKEYMCECGETFEWLEAFQAHKKSHKKPASMECVTCHKVFTNETFYKRHRYIHDPEYWDRFKCQICQRPFRDAQALNNHKQLHNGIKPHMCDLCGRTYNRHANMLKHRKLHKPPNQWEHKCNQCEATYERMKDLMAHIERCHNSTTAENEKNAKDGSKQFKWICRFCGKRISTKLSLQDHERIHTGLKPYICEWCGREFRSRPNLLQHHLTHTGDRKHSCGVCGKKFARKSFITQHMRVHTGEKPFECNICGHRFTQAGDMRRHHRRHADIKMSEFITRDTELKTSSTVS